MSIGGCLRYCIFWAIIGASTFASGTDGFTLTVRDWHFKDLPGKIQSVKDFIEVAQLNGIAIRNSPESYVEAIEQLYQENPDAAKASAFEIIMRIVAVRRCDYTDGLNPFAIAEKHLGHGFMKSLELQFPEEHAKVMRGCR